MFRSWVFSLTLLALTLSLHAHSSEKHELSESDKYLIAKSRTNLQKLIENQNNIVGVEFIYAEANNSKLSETWGHSMLHFVDNDDDWQNNIVISFSALMDPGTDIAKQIWNGVIARNYLAFPQVANFAAYWNQYTANKGRSLTRKVIITTKEQRDRIIEVVSHWLDDIDYFGNYSFIGNNCASMITDLLRKSGIKHFSYGVNSPREFLSWLEQGRLSTVPASTLKNPIKIMREFRDRVQVDFDKLGAGEGWPINTVEILEELFSPQEIFLFTQVMNGMPVEISREIVSKYRAVAQKSQVSTMLGYVALPENLYQACTTDKCMSEYQQGLRNSFSEEVLMNYHLEVKQLTRRVERLIKSKKLNATTIRAKNRIHEFESDSPQKLHFQLFTQENKGV